ncbi:hypothetical protein [Streptomyces pseudovenezuelae]|nr:hypothetical protein [Streptomyces pseudovenezuelae]
MEDSTASGGSSGQRDEGHDDDQGTAPDTALALGTDLAAMWATARGDVRLMIALAGRDPDATAERARITRAEYLRLPALGVPRGPRGTDQLITGAGDPSSWRADPSYAQACDAVAAVVEVA